MSIKEFREQKDKMQEFHNRTEALSRKLVEAIGMENGSVVLASLSAIFLSSCKAMGMSKEENKITFDHLHKFYCESKDEL